MKYTNSYTIGYFGTDNQLCLTPSSLVVYLQDIAIAHSNALGYTLDWLAERHRGWAIINWHIKIERLPKFGETIQVETWCNRCRRMQAERSFAVLDENGKEIVKAVSRWIYMDLEKRCPSVIDKEMEERYTSRIPMALTDERYQMPKVGEAQLFSEREFAVTRRDTDTNGHVNNTKYIEWAVDDVPDEIYHHYTIDDIKVVYRKECYKDSQVKSRCFLDRAWEGFDFHANKQPVKLCRETTELTSFFVEPSDESIVFAEVTTHWVDKWKKWEKDV